jgi:hypothetical protein
MKSVRYDVFLVYHSISVISSVLPSAYFFVLYSFIYALVFPVSLFQNEQDGQKLKVVPVDSGLLEARSQVAVIY